MDEKLLWELFRDTGDPFCWLLARSAARQKPPSQRERVEKAPAARRTPADRV